MDATKAQEIVNDIEELHTVSVETDADTVIVQVKDSDRSPRNFTPNALAQLLQHDAVFDAWVDENKFFVQFN